MSAFLAMSGFLLAIGVLTVVCYAAKKRKTIWWFAFLVMAAGMFLFGWGAVIDQSGYPSLEAVASGNHRVITADQEAGKWYVVTCDKEGIVRLFALPQRVVEERTGADKKLVVAREGGFSRVTLILPETPEK